jgi:hypothetical protein
MTKLRSIFFRVALVAVASSVALVVLELVARQLDGYPLLTLRLPPGGPPAAFRYLPTVSLAGKASTLNPAPDTDPAWIDVSPPLLIRPPVHPEFLELRSRWTGPAMSEFDLYNVWNRKMVEERGCTNLRELSRLPMPLRVFESVDGTAYPPYRYYPSRTTPLGMTTNAFGFRGPEIPLDKPAKTIRIAFLGASTTVGSYGAPYSYPEYVVHWLNLWAERTKAGVRFDGINAGRTGMTSTHIAAVARQEVLPFEPDLLVYYEGSNQFIFTDENLAGDEFPPLGRRKSPWQSVVDRASPYSALVTRTALGLRKLEGREPEPTKPPYTLRWPTGLDMEAPDLDRSDLPLDLSKIVSDLGSIRDAASAHGAELAVSSFMIFVHEGLELDPHDDVFLYDWLNQRCWPYTYRDLRRLADFQNRVFESFAQQENLLFVDVAGRFPAERQWFFDPIHFTNDGMRLQAWVVFQSLLPRIRDRIGSGAWPRPDREPLAAHPNLRGYHDYVLPCAE